MDPSTGDTENLQLCGAQVGMKEYGTDGTCNAPALLHYIWDEQLNNSFVCDLHAVLVKDMECIASHNVGDYCGDPKARFFEYANKCGILVTLKDDGKNAVVQF